MRDLTGTTLGHYHVTEKLGEGGMGQVWRATDTRLGRELALKILPEAFAADEERLARFEQEARILASFSHDNIATLYGLETDHEQRFIAMELIEGQDLTAVLARGPLGIDEAIRVAIQIARALETAHERGVIHRDLKPANVMIEAGGRVKVLDFGLAKSLETGPRQPGLTDTGVDAPTRTVGLTEAGTVLGTAGYMSPEQVRGLALDTRTDIWAFGVILWEMIVGRRLFDGRAASEVFASVLRDEPDWESLPKHTHPGIQRLLRRCLRRDPGRRLQHVGDARIELEEAVEEPALVEAKVPPGPNRDEVVEKTWDLTTEVCRHLSRETLDPAVIGDKLSYMDNERDSDTLVVYVPGFGFGHGQFEEILARSPYRCLAVTPFGFGEVKRRRIPLPIGDHEVLLRLFLESALATTRPRTTVLCGFSSGSDLLLGMVAEGTGNSQVDALLALSPNLSQETCFFSRLVAAIPENNDEEIFRLVRGMAAEAESPEVWLQMIPYGAEIIRKYHADVDALRSLGRDIVAPFLEPDQHRFADVFRAARDAGIVVRAVFAGAEEVEQTAVRSILLDHLDAQRLGPHFNDADIVSEPGILHLGLMRAQVIERHLEELLSLLRDR